MIIVRNCKLDAYLYNATTFFFLFLKKKIDDSKLKAIIIKPSSLKVNHPMVRLSDAVISFITLPKSYQCNASNNMM